MHDTEVTIKWATNKNEVQVAASVVHQNEKGACAAFYEANMSSYLETSAKATPPLQQETQDTFLPFHEGDVGVFQNGPLVKLGCRSYLVLPNYGCILDGDHATCTKICTVSKEEVTLCLDPRNTDIAQRGDSNWLTGIFRHILGN